MPDVGGDTVYVSGTAAIDAQGNTLHAGKSEAQIEASVENVRAVLQEIGCRNRHMVQANAYCKSPQVQEVFRTKWADLNWPCVSVIADTCHSDLLFEIEATACPGAREFG